MILPAGGFQGCGARHTRRFAEAAFCRCNPHLKRQQAIAKATTHILSLYYLSTHQFILMPKAAAAAIRTSPS